MTTSPSAKERAAETTGAAADEGKHVGGVAKEEARNVAGEAAHQARSLVDEAMTQVNDQSRTQRDRLVGTLRSVGDDLHAMVQQSDSHGLAADLTRQAADRAHAISSHMDGKEPGELLDEVRDFARRKPGLFMLGALGAGVLVGRLARGAKDAKSGTGSRVTQTPAPGGAYGGAYGDTGYVTSGPGAGMGTGNAGTGTSYTGTGTGTGYAGTGSLASPGETVPPTATGVSGGFDPDESQASGSFGTDVPDAESGSRIGRAGGPADDEAATGYPRSTP